MKKALKLRIVSLLLIVVLVFQLSACGFAKTATDTVSSKAKEAINSISEWYKGIDLQKFKDGWETVVGYIGSAYSATMSSEYVSNIGNAINDLKVSVNTAYGSARGVAQEAGFAAEKWVAGTFNIDAAARESSYNAEVVGSNELGSVDVTTNYGENASLKYYQSPKGSAEAQSQARAQFIEYCEYAGKTPDPLSLQDYMDAKGYDAHTQNEMLSSLYNDQTRIIPTDQLDEAIAFLSGKIKKLSAVGGDVESARAKMYQETLGNLKDRLHAPDGTESKPATYEEMQAIAELSQNGEFKPEDFGITISQVITPKYVVKQAIGTGLEIGLLKTVFTVGPDLISILVEAVKSGELDEEALEETGIEGAVAMSEGFVEGSVSRVVVTLCQEGVLGETLKNASPNVVGALVYLTIEAMISGYSLAKGEITAEEYGCLMADKTMITALAVPTTALMLSILPGTKLFLLIGCFAGGIIASTGYTLGKEAVMEFVDGGGFEAIIPAGLADPISSAKTAVSSLKLSEQLSNLKEFAVTTLSDGFIKVKGLVD